MQFRILGPVQVWRDGEPVELGGARRVTLLAALLVRANVTCPAEYLIHVLWGDEPPPAAAATLHSHIAHLRRVLEPGRSARQAPTILKSVQNGYLLAVAPEDLDAAVFESLLRSGRAALAENRPEQALAALNRALGLWRGEALSGFADRDFAAAEAARLEQLRVDAAEARLEALAASGAHGELVADAQRLVTEQPLRERLWELLLLGLYRSGRQADALAAYQRARTLLVEQLGVDPRPSLRELERRILNQDPALDAPTLPSPRTAADSAMSATPRLGAAPAAEGPAMPVTREAEAGTATASAETASAPAPPAALPTATPGAEAPLTAAAGATAPPRPPPRPALPSPLSSFVGRAAERAGLAEAISQHRLVTAVGLGGVGKTRLALAVAEDVAGQFTDGVCFVDLVAVTEPSRVAAVVAARLGIGETSRRPVEEAVADELADRHLLLVLDNCEHLVEGVTPFAERLLLSCPRLVILATSRARLMVPFEQVFPVPGLSLPDAVALFVERARAAGGTDLTAPEDRARIAAICEALEGHALAIELAAARLPALGLTGLEAGLANHLRLLAGGPRAQGRHRSLRAALQWSEALLDAPDQALLRRVAVFVSPFTVEAAVQVAGFPPVDPRDVADGLARLTEQSLLARIRHPQPAGHEPDRHESVAPDDGPRYRMQETLRQYGKERLAAVGELETARGRHLRWSLETATSTVAGTEDLQRWVPTFDRVADDLRDALNWAAEQPQRRQEAAELANSFAGLAFLRGLLSEAQQRYEQAARLATDRAAAAAALRDAAGAAFCRIFGTETVRLLQAAAEAELAAGRTLPAAQDLAAAAVVMARHSGVFPRPVAPEAIDDLLARATALAPDAPLVRSAELVIDVFRGEKGRHQVPRAERAVELAREAGDPLAESAALDALSDNHLAATNLDAALVIALRRVELLDQLPLHAAVGAELLDALHMAAEVCLVAGDLISARQWAQRFSGLPFMTEQEHVATNRLMVIDALAGTWDDLLVASERYRAGWERGGRPRGMILARGAAAVALVHGLRGHRDAREQWLAVVADHGLSDDPRIRLDTGWAPTFDAIGYLHEGRADAAVACLAADPGELHTSRGASWRKWYAALWAEAAVLAGMPDAEQRVDRARGFCAGNPVASAIVERAAGLLTRDRNAILAAAQRLHEAGCPYQWVRSLVLAGRDERREGEDVLYAMGAAPMVIPAERLITS